MPPRLPLESLRRHRETVAAGWNLAGGVVLVPSGLMVPVAGSDGFHEFHVHADHYYLAGTDAPGQILAYDPNEGFVLFAHVPTPEERVWESAGEPLEAIAERTGLDAVLPREEFEGWLGRRSAHPLGLVGNPDLIVRPEGYGLPGLSLRPDLELSARLTAAVAEARLIKNEGELDLMRLAAAATDVGHRTGMRLATAGMTERALQVEIETGFFRGGGERTAYPSIVGAGANAAVLHGAPSDRRIGKGDLVLVDAGAAVGGYMCDVTRTFPVSGAFTPEQADLYDLVLAVQEAAVAKALPGKEYREIHLEACVEIARGLVDLEILVGDPEGLVERGAHALFFPHGIGHMIGLVTHDVGGYAEGRERSDRFGLCYLRTDRPLEAGHVVTIEPGIYFIGALLGDPARRERFADAVNWEKADAMLGFGGVRIEDDVRVTEDEPEVLTAAVPKARAEVEAACGEE